MLLHGIGTDTTEWAANTVGGGNSGAKIYMVDITGRVEVPVPSPGFGSDPAWSPLLP